jgi:hypothetical protein
MTEDEVLAFGEVVVRKARGEDSTIKSFCLYPIGKI